MRTKIRKVARRNKRSFDSAGAEYPGRSQSYGKSGAERNENAVLDAVSTGPCRNGAPGRSSIGGFSGSGPEYDGLRHAEDVRAIFTETAAGDWLFTEKR